MPRKVFMGNLPEWVGDEEIQSWLNAAGIVCDEVHVARDLETQESKGYALLQAASEQDMEALVERFNRAPIENRVLRVAPAKTLQASVGRRKGA